MLRVVAQPFVRMQAFHSVRYQLPLPSGHRFPAGKYPALKERVASELLDIRLAEAPAASYEELLRVHTRAYIDHVSRGTLSTSDQREIGFPWSEAMVERSRHSVGATLAAMRAAMGEGISVNLAGGTHHAYANHGSGYCVFNDVAVAARALQAEEAISPEQCIAVIDLDVHQGNGTAAIFESDASVYTLSLHGERNFPFRKERSDLDVALPDGCSDGEYLEALDGALQTLWAQTRSRPIAFAFYLAGADPHEGDRLGRLALTTRGLAERDRRVLHTLLERRIPVALSMAGGYGKRIDDTVEVHMQTLREALVYWRRWNNLSG